MFRILKSTVFVPDDEMTFSFWSPLLKDKRRQNVERKQLTGKWANDTEQLKKGEHDEKKKKEEFSSAGTSSSL